MAGELMAFYGEPIDTDPITALLDEVRRTAGHIAWLGERIGQFNVDVSQIETDEQGKEVSRPAGLPPEVDGWLRQYLTERAHLVRVSAACLNAGINERLVQIAEHQAEKLADAVEVILAGLELTAAQQSRVPQLVPRVLRQLTTVHPLLIEQTEELP
jgi:hypothetical protein